MRRITRRPATRPLRSRHTIHALAAGIGRALRAPTVPHAGKRRSPATLLAGTLLLSLSAPLPAQVSNWTGASSDNWFAATNWDSNQVPTAADDVVINTTLPNATLIGGGDALADFLFVGQSGLGNLTISGGGTLTSVLARIGVDAGAQGVVAVSGAGSAWNNSGLVNVGNGGTGSLAITDGGAVSTGVVFLGNLTTGTGMITVDGAGSVMTANGAIFVGDIGAGTLAITNGGHVESVGGVIGDNATAQGMVTVSGADSSWANSNVLLVGRIGTGELDIGAGGTVSAVSATLGDFAGVQGTVSIDGSGSSLGVGNALTIGGAGTGTLTIDNGGAADAGAIVLGRQAGGQGTLTISDAGSLLTPRATFGDFIIGWNGTGTLAVDAGGTVDGAGNAYLGLESGSQGNASVTGAGSQWLVDDGLFVGAAGEGLLSIDAGGRVEAGGIVVGLNEGGTGAVTLTGAGSALAVDELTVASSGDGSLIVEHGGQVDSANGMSIGSIGTGAVTVTGVGSVVNAGSLSFVGFNSNGSLDVLDGGVVNGGDARIGNAANGQGLATVSGTGSQWNNTGELIIGVAGTGTLAIDNGGVVSSGTAVIGRDANGVGAVTVDGAGSEWTIIDDLVVANAGTGSLDITAGGTLISTSTSVGEGVGSQGAVTVSGADSSWISDGSLEVGGSGSGELNIDAGGTVSNTAAAMGAVAGSQGTVTVTGTGSAWTNGDVLVVGVSGTGTLGILSGGTVSNGRVGIIAEQAGSQGAVTVSDAGSQWNSSGGLVVGDAGAGSLVIADGGTVNAATNAGTLTHIGLAADGSGTVTVTGAGSMFNSGGTLNIGRDGSGTLLVDSGAIMISNSSNIAANTGSTGDATVTGMGSIWDAGDGLSVGDQGSGKLTVSDGGAVSATAGVGIAQDAGATGILNIGAGEGEAAVAAGLVETPSITFGAGNGTINFNHTDSDYVFDAAIGGSGTINQLAGTTSLTGAGDAGGALNVRGGTLRVEGTLGDTATTVFDGATLGGSGAISGDVAVQDGGILAPGSSAGTLTLGSLALSAGSLLDYELGHAGVIGGSVNDLIEIGGDLTLDGTLNITDIGGFGAGVYRLMNYGGALTDNTLDLGTLPGGSDPQDLFVQTAIGGQVNLVSSAGLTLTFWDGAIGEQHNDGAINGGAGTWSADNDNWTAADGALNGRWDDGEFAVFGGTGGNVSVVGEQAVAGLQFMSGYTLAAGAGGALSIDDAETVIRVDPDVSATIGVDIGGTGGLVKTDTGTLVLSGNNTYLGGTTIRTGTLSVSADANLGDASGGLAFEGGTLQNTAAFGSARDVDLAAAGGIFLTDADLTLSGGITGAGMLTKDGAGRLILGGDNSYAGGTRVLAGTLVGDSGSIRGDLDNDGSVVFDQADDGTFAGAIAGDGTMAKRGDGALTLTGSSALDWSIDAGALVSRSALFSGDATIADGARLRFEEQADGNYAGTIAGAGTFEIAGGDAVFALTGNSAGFGGITSVESGTLQLDGRLGGSTLVASGATLRGIGTLHDVDNHGTIAPGHSIGTLTLTGDYIHHDDATLLAEIEPGGSSDLLDIAGSATIEGGTVDVLKAPGQYAGGTRYTLIDAASGVTGSFGTLEQDLPFLDLLLAYDANHVYLDVQRNDVGFDIVCGDGTFNQCQVAGALDRVADGEVTDDLQATLAEVTTLDLPGAQAAFDTLSGEAHGSLAGILLEGHALYGQTVSRRIADRREAVGAERLRGGAWVRAYGASSDLDGDGNAHAADFEQRGLAVGFDAWGGERWLIGASFNAMSVDADFRPGDHGEADAKNASLYASVQGEHAYLDAVTSFAWWDNDITRRIEVGSIAREARSEYGGHRFATHLEAGWTFALGQTQQLTPLVSVEYAKLDQEGFREEGAQDLDLIGRSQDVERTTVSAGLRWATAFERGEWTFEPMLQARWLHAFGDEHAEQAVAFAGASEIGYRVRGVSWPQDRGLVGIGLQLRHGDNLDLFVDVDYQKGGRLEAKHLGAGLRWRW